MQLRIERNTLVTLLQKVVGVVDRKQTLPILGNVLIQSGAGRLRVTATDLEVELIAEAPLDSSDTSQSITVPGRKFFDICRSLPEGQVIDLTFKDERLQVNCGKARFALATLPAAGFPNFDSAVLLDQATEVSIDSHLLRAALDKSMFAMASQDVRFYLNGLLLDVGGQALRAIASDGHRLAWCEQTHGVEVNGAARNAILPRKGVAELYRLLADAPERIELTVGSNALRARLDNSVFSVKLVDAKYPDYRRVIPSDLGRVIYADKEALKQAVARVAVVCQEKLKGVRFVFETNSLTVSANGTDQEEATDTLDVEYTDAPFETAYNGSYILDALGHCQSERVSISVADSSTACIIEGNEDVGSRFIVMPLRL